MLYAQGFSEQVPAPSRLRSARGARTYLPEGGKFGGVPLTAVAVKSFEFSLTGGWRPLWFS